MRCKGPALTEIYCFGGAPEGDPLRILCDYVPGVALAGTSGEALPIEAHGLSELVSTCRCVILVVAFLFVVRRLTWLLYSCWQHRLHPVTMERVAGSEARACYILQRTVEAKPSFPDLSGSSSSPCTPVRAKAKKSRPENGTTMYKLHKPT